MATMTLTDLITATRERCDMQSTEFITDSELTSYINQSYQELYDLLVQKYGNDYFVADPYIFTTPGDTDVFDLPEDFQKLLGVDLQANAGNVLDNSWVTLLPFMFIERNRYSGPNLQSFYGITNLRYRLRNNKLWFTPLPSGGQIMRMFYIPQLAPLVSGSDEANNLGGWLEYVITDACIKCLAKEESDTSVFMAQKQALIARIEAAAENRDAGSPQTVGDSRYDDYWWPGTGNGSSGGY